MPTITPFLWFDDNAEEAIEFYASIFPDSSIGNISRQNGKLFLGEFELAGQKFMALNGGPQFKFTEALSLYVNCKDQADVDHFLISLVVISLPAAWLGGVIYESRRVRR
jgi:predicted 3-demethylubiquinone-9 3-methyltransferase (glyoxalase superfamily)